MAKHGTGYNGTRLYTWILAGGIAPALLALVCLAQLAQARATSAGGAGLPAPHRFDARGVAPGLRSESAGRVRVLIALREQPALMAALHPKRRPALTGRLSRSELNSVRRGGVDARALARRKESERERTLLTLAGPLRRAVKLQAPVIGAIESAGGQVAERDLLSNTVAAWLPGKTVAGILRRSDVRAVENAPKQLTRSLATSTRTVGAPSFWALGFSGGRGSDPQSCPTAPCLNDVSPTDLAIVNDKIQQDHPAFEGIEFHSIGDEGIGTPCGNNPGNCDHGTAVASVAISRGASGCFGCMPADIDEEGVAPGLDSVLDASSNDPNVNGVTWALGFDQVSDNELVEGASDPAEIASSSQGSPATTDDTDSTKNMDNFVATFGLTFAVPAGNEGISDTIDSPCIAYNTLCAGGIDTQQTDDTSDDTIWDGPLGSSSHGPSPGGRKKPDLVAVATPGQYAERRWQDNGLWSVSLEGTSFASPQVAAAAALLAGSGISDPMVQKAILINSARQGRSTPSANMGTQSAWQPDWGWGALNLDAAVGQRSNVETGEISAGSVHFYTSTAAVGDRVTLVWHRRATGCVGPGCVATDAPLTNLDLYQLAESDGTVRATSSSDIDNVEQVRTEIAEETIYKVKAAPDPIVGMDSEPYAIASTQPLAQLVTPKPTTAVTLSAPAARPGEDVQVEAVVRNPSPDLTAENVEVALEVPAGVQVVTGDQPQSPPSPGGELAEEAQFTANWTVRGTSDGTRQIVARTSAERYGEDFETSGSRALIVDSTPPVPSISVPPGAVANPALGVGWSATDAGSGVASYDVEVAVDGGPFAPWLSATAATGATYQGTPGHAYRFRVRARDTLGNLSGFVESPEVRVVSQAGNGVGPSGSPPPLRHSFLRIARARLSADKVSVLGTLRRDATGRVLIGYVPRLPKPKAKSAGKTRERAGKVKPVRITARIRRGRFAATIRLPHRVRKARRGRLTVAYTGDRRHRPAQRRLTVERPRPKKRR